MKELMTLFFYKRFGLVHHPCKQHYVSNQMDNSRGQLISFFTDSDLLRMKEMKQGQEKDFKDSIFWRRKI